MTITPEYLHFKQLSEGSKLEFAGARNFVAQTARELLGAGDLTQTERDFSILQALAEHDAMKSANYEAWVALGIAFGDVLADYIPGLAWRLVTDQTGTYAALQFEAKRLSIAAPTMLWKRVERGEEFDLAFMAGELKAFVQENASHYGDA